MRRDTKQKVLLLFLSGLAMSLSRSPKGYYKILNNIPKQLKEIRRKRLYGIVREFYNDRLVDYKEDKDGIIKIVSSPKKGKKKLLKFKLDEMEIKKPAKWDGEWRIVILTFRKDSKKPEKR